MNLIQTLFSSFSTTSCLILVLIMILSIAKLGKRSKNTKLPPGPWKLPIIGSLHHLAAGLLPHQTFYKLSKIHGPLMHLKLGEISTYVISSPIEAKYALKTDEIAFGAKPITSAIKILSYDMSGIIFTPYGDHWRQVRKICVTHLLSSKKVRSLQYIREQEVSNLIDFIRRSVGSPVNLSAKLSSFSSSIVLRALFGEKLDDQNLMLEIMKEALTLIGTFNFTDFFPSLPVLAVVSGTKSKSQNMHDKVDKIMDEIINKHRHHNEKGEKEDDDVLDILLRLQQRNELPFPITDNIIKALLLELFAAATDSSSSAMEWAMSEMIKNPRVMQKAQSQLRLNLEGKNYMDGIVATRGLCYLNNIIKEALRFHPPIPLMSRECKEDFEINGYKIPRKTKVVFNIWAMGRNAQFWTDAESFIPERFEKKNLEFNGTNYEYLPFGEGRRLCPGVLFALTGIELGLAQILYHFDWKLPHGLRPEDLDMREAFGLVAGRKYPLYLIPYLKGSE